MVFSSVAKEINFGETENRDQFLDKKKMLQKRLGEINFAKEKEGRDQMWREINYSMVPEMQRKRLVSFARRKIGIRYR